MVDIGSYPEKSLRLVGRVALAEEELTVVIRVKGPDCNTPIRYKI